MILDKIAIVGAGSWGCALANAAIRAGRTVTLYARDPATIEAIHATRRCPRLPEVIVDERAGLAVLNDDFAPGDAVLLVVPAQTMREVANRITTHIPAGTPVITCSKGIERGTYNFMTDVILDCIPQATPAILSGPSFATDVASGLPTAVTLATLDRTTATELAAALGSATFRPYHSTDIRGVEIGGAAKNVLAIAAGIVAGRALGASAAAALTTRGFAELFRFGKALGARPETLTGLSGLGDLILTCSSLQSRNYSLGYQIGRGHSPQEALAGGKLVEGALTAPVLVDMARQTGIEMPIASAVAAVLGGELDVTGAIDSLLNRPFRAEG